MNPQRIVKILMLLNVVLVFGLFGRAFLFGPEIERRRLEVERYAEKHQLNTMGSIGMNAGSELTEISVERMKLFSDQMDEYVKLIEELLDLKSKQQRYFMWGQIGFFGFPVLGFVAIILAQRERDNFEIVDAQLSGVQGSVYCTPSLKKEGTKRIVISTEESIVFFDGFALLKGFVISPKEITFEVPFDAIIDCFFQPLKNGRSNLILLTAKGKVMIPDRISDYENLFQNLKILAAQTPNAKLMDRPWFQGILIGTIIALGLALVFGVYLLFFDS